MKARWGADRSLLGSISVTVPALSSRYWWVILVAITLIALASMLAVCWLAKNTNAQKVSSLLLTWESQESLGLQEGGAAIGALVVAPHVEFVAGTQPAEEAGGSSEGTHAEGQRQERLAFVKPGEGGAVG